MPAEPQRRCPDVLESLPPLPPVALRVVQVTQDPRASAADLATVVASDPALSARILRVANSAAYRAVQEVTSVQAALVRLGFVQARNIALSAALTGAYAPDQRNALFRIDEFWRHSLAVAFRSAELAAQRPQLDVPTAFTAGLLHDIGRLALYYADPAGMDQAVAAVLAGTATLEAAELAETGYRHGDVGGALCRRWGLPERIAEAAAGHHDHKPSSAYAALVAEADGFCTAAGFLPGYVLPPAAGTKRAWPPAAEGLARQVEGLMQLICEPAVGVRR